MSNTPRRTIRIPDTVWSRAQDVAGQNGESVSTAVKRFLETYVDDPADEPADASTP